MIEFKLTVRIDTQDPRIAYDELQQMLRFSGLDFTVSDEVLINNKPLPKPVMNNVAWQWQRQHGGQRNHYRSTDPGFQTLIDALGTVRMDANDIRNLAYLRAGVDDGQE